MCELVRQNQHIIKYINKMNDWMVTCVKHFFQCRIKLLVPLKQYITAIIICLLIRI